ncbi:hypothetical protein WJX73_001358 [Symbiochloris irregularis]|uniref:Transmembrane protein n=1 Tax=Symbiochloris irregularis TaxID=706552 RepID=A0AAW1P119_9CHLO
MSLTRSTAAKFVSLRHGSRRHTLRSCARHRTFSRDFATLRAATETAESASPAEDEKAGLEDQMEQFLKQQAERESGGSLAQSQAQESGTEVGTDVVSDEDVKRFCRDISQKVKLLKSRRDMTVNEVKLTLAIEDPNVREQRTFMSVEHSSGASRDEVAAALVEVTEGRVPKDRVALRELHREMMEWPFLDAEDELDAGSDSNYEGITETGTRKPLRPKQMKRDPNEKPQSILDTLPDWVGYTALYGISSLPVIIGVTVVVILFLNSLR